MDHQLTSRTLEFPAPLDQSTLFKDLERVIFEQLGITEAPVRFAVTASEADQWQCEMGVVAGDATTPISHCHRPACDTVTANLTGISVGPSRSKIDLSTSLNKAIWSIGAGISRERLVR